MKDPLHILIVDDDPDDTEFLSGAFSRQFPDVRFTTAQNGQEALDLLLKDGTDDDCPDVAFLDLHMPGMGGYQVLTALRDAEQCRKFPIMVISTSIQPSEKERCRQAGCTAYFTKPTSLGEYDDIVATTLLYLRKHSGLNA